MSNRETVEHWIEKAAAEVPSDSKAADYLREALYALERAEFRRWICPKCNDLKCGVEA